MLVVATLLKKSTKDDIRRWPTGIYVATIRRMDEILPVGLDCDHYKML